MNRTTNRLKLKKHKLQKLLAFDQFVIDFFKWGEWILAGHLYKNQLSSYLGSVQAWWWTDKQRWYSNKSTCRFNLWCTESSTNENFVISQRTTSIETRSDSRLSVSMKIISKAGLLKVAKSIHRTRQVVTADSRGNLTFLLDRRGKLTHFPQETSKQLRIESKSSLTLFLSTSTCVLSALFYFSMEIQLKIQYALER